MNGRSWFDFYDAFQSVFWSTETVGTTWHNELRPPPKAASAAQGHEPADRPEADLEQGAANLVPSGKLRPSPEVWTDRGQSGPDLLARFAR